MSQKEDKEIPIPRLTLINSVFKYGAFSLLQEGSYLRLIYTFVRENPTTDFIAEGLTLSTGILCTSYKEAAYHINALVYQDIIPQTTLNQGSVYNEKWELVETLDWGKLLKELLLELGKEPEEVVLH